MASFGGAASGPAGIRLGVERPAVRAKTFRKLGWNGSSMPTPRSVLRRFALKCSAPVSSLRKHEPTLRSTCPRTLSLWSTPSRPEEGVPTGAIG